jgi:hypothetical protein
MTRLARQRATERGDAAAPAPAAPGARRRLGAPAVAGWARRHAGPLTAVALALLALGPLLAPGYVLTYDMLFTPWPRLQPGLLGLGGDLPRNVPSDLLVALPAQVVPPWLVQKAVLLGTLAGAGWGAARLAPTRSPAGRAAAATLYCWNAFVYERLVMGHWAMLVGYAAMPWAARAAADWRAGRPGGAVRLGGALAVAACGSPQGSVMAAGVAAAVLLTPAPRWAGGTGDRPAVDGGGRAPTWLARAGLLAGMVLVLNVPWLVPSLLHPGGVPVRTAGVEAFASRPDTPLGTLGSLLSLGGIWNAYAVPPGRASLLWLPGFAVLVVVAVAGWRLVPARLGRGAAAGLLVAAALGLLVAGGWAVPWLRPAVLFLIERVPGGGLFRDAQKHVAALALAQAVGLAVGVELVLARIGARAWRLAVAVVLALGPVLVLPPLAWGLGGRLAAVPFPPSWAAARDVIAADEVPGAALVLPWHRYLALPWNGGRVVTNPAIHVLLPRRVILNDDLELPGITVAGEDQLAARLGPVVRGGGPLAADLAAAGVRYVLVVRGGSGAGVAAGGPRPPAGQQAARALGREAATAEARLAGADRVLDLPDLALYRLDRPAPLDVPALPAAPVIAADLAAAALALWLVALNLRRRRGARRRDGPGGAGAG